MPSWTEPWLRAANETGLGTSSTFVIEWRHEVPGGCRTQQWVVTEGRIASVRRVGQADPDLVVTARGSLADESDSLDVESAVFNGRLRLSGSMEAFVALERARMTMDEGRPSLAATGELPPLEDEPGFRDLKDVLPKAANVLSQARRLGIMTGAQLYVSLAARPVVDVGVGQSADGMPMSADCLLSWRCATKPLVAVAVAQLWERDRLDIGRPIGERFGGGLAQLECTAEHLLRHEAPFVHDPPAEAAIPLRWDELLQAIGRARLQPGRALGSLSGYSLWTSWAILGTLVSRLDGRPLADYLREEIFQPLGMEDTWVGIPSATYRAYGTRMTPTRDLRPGRARWQELRDGEEACDRCSPADGGRGPAHDLGAFYEAMDPRRDAGRPVLSSAVLDKVLTARRPASANNRRHPFSRPLRWGLGFLRDGPALGQNCSLESFGHHSMENTISVADPKYGIVVVALFNTLSDEMLSARRNQLLVRAIYQDLSARILT